MFKRILSCLLVFVLLLGMAGTAFAAEPQAPVYQTVTAQKQDSVTVQLSVPGGTGSGNGRLIYQFPEELTLKSARSLVSSEGVSDLSTSATSVSFAWACYEDYTAETAILELTFAGMPGAYSGTIVLPEQNNETVEVKIILADAYRYVDVTDENLWYFDYVYAAYDAELMNGVGHDYFDPDGNLTRAAMATLLYRMDGAPAVSGESGFSDVAGGVWYTDAILWAAENEIVNGYPDGTFQPDGNITRQEAVTMLSRYMDYKSVTLEKTAEAKTFTDEAKIAGWAKDAVTRCVEGGLLEGYPDGSFQPEGLITRAEAAKLIVKLYDQMNAPVVDPTEPSEDPTEPSEPSEPPEPQEPYTVTFVGDRGYAKVDGKKVSSVTLEPGQTWLTFTLFGDQSTGYELDDVKATSGTLSKNGSAFVLKDIQQDVTVSFSTKDMVLTVNFVSKQSATIEPSSVQVPWGEVVAEPEATRTGYEAVGWYTDAALEQPWDFSQPVYENMTLYVKWDVKYFTASFMDGDTVLFTQQVRYSGRVERPNTPEKEGYLFAGWYADPELTTAYSFYKAISEDICIYASWRVDDRADYIYLGGNESGNANYGVLGDDANDGSSMENAVKTFERAKELLKDAKNPVILICGMVTVTEDTTWSMADLPNGKIMRNANGFSTACINVDNEATLTLDHIVIDGGTTTYPALQTTSMTSSMVTVQKGSNLVVNEGTVVQNCGNSKATTGAIYGWGNNEITVNEGTTFTNNVGGYTGALSVSSGSTVVINGGDFSGNIQTGNTSSHEGSGTALSVSGSTDNPSTLTVNGGTFTGNQAGISAAVSIRGDVKMTMNGGTVTGNSSNGVAGGISVGYGTNGASTLILNSGVIKENTSAASEGDPAISVLGKGSVVFNGSKDSVEMDGIYVNYTAGAYGLYAAKPLSYLKGSAVEVYYNMVDINTVLLRGYDTYKITELDVAAYRLMNGLDSDYFKTVLDKDMSVYKVAYGRNIGMAVYCDPTKGSDENDGLTADTAVASFALAKEILASNASETGENVIFMMRTYTVNEGETFDLTMADIPNGAVLRYTTNSTYMFRVNGTMTTHDVVVDGNYQAFPYTSSHNAVFAVDYESSFHAKEGTVVQNVQSGTQSVFYLFGRKGTTTNVVIDDLTVRNMNDYVPTTSATSGQSIFWIGGLAGGAVNLTVNSGAFENLTARLLYVSGVGTNHLVFNDCTFRNNRVKGPGAVFLASHTAATSTVVDINGGVYTGNHTVPTSITYAIGGIANIASDAVFNFNGGQFSDNTSGYDPKADGISLKSPGAKLTATVVLNQLNQDVKLFKYSASKTNDNTWAIVAAPLTHTVTVWSQYYGDGFTVAKGTDTYALTEADLEKFISGDGAVTFYLDAENNAICMKLVPET